ncbi:MAG: SatD family protein [Bacillota bacterium]
MRKVTVVTADIIQSRSAGKYKESLVRKLSELQHPALISPFTLSRGDEIQGVLDGWLRAPEIVRQFRFACRPLELRIGIGTGTQEEPIAANPWEMNGPAFHRARSALDAAKSKKGQLTSIRTGSPELDEIINCIWLLIDMRQSKWTDKQWEAVQAYEKYRTYEEASKKLGISLQNVQKRCRAADWPRLKAAEKTLARTEIFAARFHLVEGDTDYFTF